MKGGSYWDYGYLGELLEKCAFLVRTIRSELKPY